MKLPVASNYKAKCIVIANQSPVVDWVGEQELTLSTNHFIIHIDGVLINSVQLEDDGIITCRARVTHTGELAEHNINNNFNILTLHMCHLK